MRSWKTADTFDLYAIMQQKNCRIIYEGADSLVLLVESLPALFTVCQSRQEEASVLAAIKKWDQGSIVLHNPELIDQIPGLVVEAECVNAVYFQNSIAPIPSPYPLRPLTLDDWKAASLLYCRHAYDYYVRTRIEAKALLGAFDGDALVGMIGTHAEGSIGFLEIDPAYRRRHLASALESKLIAQKLENKEAIYAQILSDNTASLALHKSLGMTISEKKLYWCRKKGEMDF